METEALAIAGEIDFSFWSLFMRATITVKLVILVLIAASFWAWSIIIQRTVVYRRVRREANRFDRAFWSGQPLDELFDAWSQYLKYFDHQSVKFYLYNL